MRATVKRRGTLTVTGKGGGPSSQGARSSVERSQLRSIIAGLTDGVILVEPDQTISWANAAALAMHGVDDLVALGRDVKDYRQKFQLSYRNKQGVDEGNYPLDRVVAGEAFDDVVVEVTRAGRDHPDYVHRIRSLVINDATGEPDCLVLIIKDVTDRYEAEERFQRTFAANPAPAVICRLADLRYIKVNQGFVDMTGYKRAEILGRTTYEIDLFANAERRSLAIERLSLGETIPQMEAEIDLPGGATRSVIIAGQPLEVGSEPCLLFTFADLDRQKKAEGALRQSEERFAKAFQSSPAPTVVFRLADFKLIAVNDAFTKTFRIGEHEVKNRTLDELGLWVSDVALGRFKAAAIESGAVAASEECLRASETDHLDCLVTGVSTVIADEACLLCTILDITERKRTERELTAAIDKVMADMSWFSRGVIEKLADMRGLNRRSAVEGRDAAVDALTKREKQVLQLICSGHNDIRIAATLKVSQHTIRNHIAALYRKLDVHNRTEAALWGHAHGFAAE